MNNIRFLLMVLLAGGLILSTSCGGGSKEVKWEITNDGLEYAFFSKNEGTTAQIGDFLTLHMEQHTSADSLLFSSLKRKKPLTFRFSETLFKGVLTSGMKMMAVGDSAAFMIPVDKLYGDKLPRFAQAGDKLKYTIKLEKIQTQEEYRKELQERKKKESVQKENARIRQLNAAKNPNAKPPPGHPGHEEGHDHNHDHSGHDHSHDHGHDH